MSKTLIMILGAGATGKTTLSRTLAGKDAQEQRVDLTVIEKGVRKKVNAPFVLGSHVAVAGNLKNTSDAIGAMDALYQTIDHCWKHRDVVIVDGFRCTNNWVRWVEEHPLKPAALFVYIELSLNENLARLRGRRAGNGKVEDKLPTKTFLNVLAFRKRAFSVWNYAQDNYKRQPVRYLEIPEGMGPEDAARLVESELSTLQEPGTQFENAPEPPVLNVEDVTVDSILNGQNFDRSLAHWEEQLLDQTPAENRASTSLDLQYGMDFRKPEYRREVFLRFYQFHTEFKLHPGLVYLLIPYLRERLNWNLEQLLWFCFINGNTQHPPTSWLIFKRFPDFAALDTATLIEFFSSEWARLEFDTDRRHQKRDFPQAVNCYKELCGDSQEEYFAGFINGSDQEQNFRSAWATVRRDFYGFGRLSAFSYLEYLRIARVPLVCDQLFLSDMKGSKSHRNGLCKVLGRDDWDWTDSNPVKYTPEMITYLENEGAKLLADARSRYPSYDTNYFTLESALCAYKNWFRGRRYPGIYADMFYDRVTKAERRWPEEDFVMFWDAYRTLPTYVQSETGVSKEKQTLFRDTGQVITMGNVWDCFMENAIVA
jgi:hypothetical protein